MGGQTALNSRARPGARRRAREVRRRADRRLARGDRHGRGPRAVPQRDARDRPRVARSRRSRARSRRRSRSPAEIGFPIVIRPSFTLGGTGGGIAYNREEFEDDRDARPRASPTGEVLIEESVHRLEGIRDGGGARPQGQLHHRLLDRELRSDGRAHRRLDHRRAGADADRQGIPAHARRLDRGAAQDRRRHRRLERAVRASIRTTAGCSSSR